MNSDPKAYGLESLDGLDAVQKATWNRQSAFLEAYESRGRITASAKAAGCSRAVVYVWQDNNTLAFRRRLEESKAIFREEVLEAPMFQALLDPKAHPLLRIFALKAHWREKYGDIAMDTDTAARETMAKIRLLRREERKSSSKQVAEEAVKVVGLD